MEIRNEGHLPKLKTAALIEKYPAAWVEAKDELSARELDCLIHLMDDGMTEPEFLRHAVSIEAGNKLAAELSRTDANHAVNGERGGGGE